MQIIDKMAVAVLESETLSQAMKSAQHELCEAALEIRLIQQDRPQDLESSTLRRICLEVLVAKKRGFDLIARSFARSHLLEGFDENTPLSIIRGRFFRSHTGDHKLFPTDWDDEVYGR